MNAIQFCAEHYGRPILEKEMPDFDGDDEFAVATVFESTLPFTKPSIETGEIEDCAFTHNNFFGYLIVQADGYYARNRNTSGLTQKGAQTNLLPKWAGYYYDLERMQAAALYNFVKDWNGAPALIIEMDKTKFNYSQWQLTYDIRHLLINTPKQSFVINGDFMLSLGQEEVAA